MYSRANGIGRSFLNISLQQQSDTARLSEASRRFAEELETDGKLRELIERIKGRLKICGM
jgi:hypothetical protein